jgi:signal transduction histidine kinase
VNSQTYSNLTLSHASSYSHEVRTPLNTLSMALDLLTAHEIFKVPKEDLLPNDNDPQDLTRHLSTPIPISQLMIDTKRRNEIKDALEIVEAMKQSCEAAVCTLNDVLLYDKIEGGTMVLEKRLISVIQILSQTIQPFMIQVSSHPPPPHQNIFIFFIPQARSNEIELSFCESSLESLRDCVFQVDVNKVSQVIRNFLSNSLKFTPSHGSVTLRAYRVEVGNIYRVWSESLLFGIIVDEFSNFTKVFATNIYFCAS